MSALNTPAPNGLIRRHVIVSGRVQGVWFREGCRQMADLRGVRGWVRNLADGTVEAVFEGWAADVATLVAWCHEGPTRANVTSVAVHDEAVTGELSFRVR